MYTIKHAAQLTGLPAATLRAWERRYGVVTPHRTDSGYRLYDEGAVSALTLMAALVADGWSPQQAALETQRRITPDADRRHPAEAVQEPRVRGSGDDAFIEAAARLDVLGLTEVLDEHFGVASFESVVDDWLMPSLVALGDAWADGRVSVAGEHLASYTVMRRLSAAYDAASSGATGPPIVVGLPPGSRHELGVLAFAVAARRAGLRAAYVGADLPTGDWVTAVAAHDARAVVLSALQETDLAALAAVVDGIRAAHPAVLIAVGGSQQDQAPGQCQRLGHDIREAATRLAALLGADASA